MIVIEALKKTREGRPVLRGIGLRVEAGRVAALIGSSGSGKTTLLRCINGLETFDEGRVEAFGVMLHGGSPPTHDTLSSLRRSVGMVFQGFHLFPHLDVLQNMTLAPVKVASFMMGAWFFATGISELIAGQLAAFTDKVARGEVFHLFGGQADFFFIFVVSSGAAALLLALLTPRLRRLMA